MQGGFATGLPPCKAKSILFLGLLATSFFDLKRAGKVGFGGLEFDARAAAICGTTDFPGSVAGFATLAPGVDPRTRASAQ